MFVEPTIVNLILCIGSFVVITAGIGTPLYWSHRKLIQAIDEAEKRKRIEWEAKQQNLKEEAIYIPNDLVKTREAAKDAEGRE